MYELQYHPSVVTIDIPRVNGSWKKRLKGSIEAKLTTDPLLYGVPLRRDLHGCYKLRVGECRVIYKVEGQNVRIITIRHRRDVYKSDINKRIN
jgi:mRNA interferase RelE/StbE